MSKQREIKFRGYQPELRGWVYGDLIQVPDWSAFILEWKDNFENRVKVDSDSIGQFTGLRDPKGVECYDRDIIEFANTEGKVFRKEVWFDEDLATWMIGEFPYYRLHESGYIQPSELVFEVIGNVHQNHELLKP